MKSQRPGYERFFRFPLAALAYDPDPVKTLTTIIVWCFLDIGERSSSIYDNAALREAVEMQSPEMHQRLSPQTRDEFLLIRGAQIAKFDLWDSCSTVLSQHAKLTAFINKNQGSASSNTVTVSSDWIGNCLNTEKKIPEPRTLSWREFRILCALLSKIGNKGFDKCGWKEIQARAAGWCGKVDMRRAKAAGKPTRKHLLLTRDQIRKTLERLETHNFLSRFQFNRAESWFSFSCKGDRKVLQEWVANRKLRRIESLREKRADDQAFSAEMSQRKSLVPGKACPPKKLEVEQTSFNGGDSAPSQTKSRQRVAKSAPPQPQVPTTLIPTSSPPLTKSNLNESNDNERAMLTAITKDPPTLPEQGYLLDGVFLPHHEVNRFVVENRERGHEIIRQAKSAIRTGSEIREITS